MPITDKFVFIHLYKTGGSCVTHSVVQVLCRMALKHHPLRFILFRINNRLLRYLPLNWIANPEWKNKIDDWKFNCWMKAISHCWYGDYHASVTQIPTSHRQKPRLISTRNPFSQITSYYFFKQLHRSPEQRTSNQEMPMLSFAEAILTIHPPSVKDSSDKKCSLSYGAYHAIRQLAPDPATVLALDEASLLQLFKRNEHKSWLNQTVVIHRENLRIVRFLNINGLR